VLEDERIARGIARDLEDDVGRELREAVLGIGADGFVDVVAEMKIETREHRARQREGPARGGRAHGERRSSREYPLEDPAGTGSRRCPPRPAAHATPPTMRVAGLSEARRDLKRDANGP